MAHRPLRRPSIPPHHPSHDHSSVESVPSNPTSPFFPFHTQRPPARLGRMDATRYPSPAPFPTTPGELHPGGPSVTSVTSCAVNSTATTPCTPHPPSIVISWITCAVCQAGLRGWRCPDGPLHSTGQRRLPPTARSPFCIPRLHPSHPTRSCHCISPRQLEHTLTLTLPLCSLR
jgi:hypothetical protein